MVGKFWNDDFEIIILKIIMWYLNSNFEIIILKYINPKCKNWVFIWNKYNKPVS